MSSILKVDTLQDVNGNAIISSDGSGNLSIPNLTTTGDINFGDNDKAVFGAGSDLQIYHDGSNSLIQDAGSGDLILKSNGTATVVKTNAGNNLISARDAGSVGVFYDGSEKLTTTSGGIDVTGTVVSDGLTVESSNPIILQHSATGPTLRFNNVDQTVADGQQLARLEFSTDDAGVEKDEAYLQLTGNGGSGAADFDFMVGDGTPVKRMRINIDGDISFYEDTGTTPKLFWDASAESLAVGDSSVDGDASALFLLGADPAGIDKGQLVLKGTATSGAADTGASITFKGHNGSGNRGLGSIQVLKENSTVGNDDTYMRFSTRDNTDGYRETMRIDSSGTFMVGKTSTSLATEGTAIEGNGIVGIVTGANPCMYANRNTDDGILIQFRQANTAEGNISVSGATVAYNGFTGTHWSRLTDNSKPTILKGTILESLDEMMDWYQVQFDITDEEGTTTTHKESYALGNGESVGDVITYTYEGTDYQATIIQEGDVKHTKSKVSDTVDAKNVYGVFVAWDNDDDTVNDMYVAQTGTFVVRMNSAETVSKGDLIQSNGDGTGKVQADDIIRASTVAKVLSTTKIETYDDGSYIVPCTLHC